MSENTVPLPDFTRWPSFPFEGDMRVKKLAPPVEVEPPRSGEDDSECVACGTPDDAYIWVSERWRVRAMDRPTGLPMVLILECRSHLDLGDLPNLLAAELGVMTVRLERAIRSLDGVARVHVNRWGDGSAHLHMWFLARPYGRLQLRGTFLSLWDDILPVIPEHQWRENLALVAAWLADFGGKAIAEPAHIEWESSGTLNVPATGDDMAREAGRRPETLGDIRAGVAGDSGTGTFGGMWISAAADNGTGTPDDMGTSTPDDMGTSTPGGIGANAPGGMRAGSASGMAAGAAGEVRAGDPRVRHSDDPTAGSPPGATPVAEASPTTASQTPTPLESRGAGSHGTGILSTGAGNAAAGAGEPES